VTTVGSGPRGKRATPPEYLIPPREGVSECEGYNGVLGAVKVHELGYRCESR
jgi:hypothetical protein